MRKLLKKIALFLLCILVINSVAACGSSESKKKSGIEQKVAGTYECSEYIYVFAQDGTMRLIELVTSAGYPQVTLGTYSADKKTIEIVIGDSISEYDYELTEDDLTMYKSGSSEGKVLRKTADGKETAGLKNDNLEAVSGVYKSANVMIRFSGEGTCFVSTNGINGGVCTIEGNCISMGDETVTFDVDNGLFLFKEGSSKGVYYYDVAADYADEEAIYSEAKSLLTAGKYDEAASKFSSISGYFDSTDMARRAYYEKGCELYESEKYEEAIAALSSANNYLDSADIKKECQKIIDLRSIEKISFGFISKESEAYIGTACPYNKSPLSFTFGIEIENLSEEQISSVSFNVSIKDFDDNQLMSFDVDLEVDIAAGTTETIDITREMEEFSDIAMEDVVVHMMNTEDFTVDIELDSISLNKRKVSDIHDKRHLQTSKGRVSTTNVVGSYSWDIWESGNQLLVFADDGTIQYTAESYVYNGTYSTDGNKISINFDIEQDDPWESASYGLVALSAVNEFRLINNILFLRDPSSEGISGYFLSKVEYVEITLPADLVDNSGEKIKVGDNGVISGKLNDDGSVTYKVTKAKQQEVLDEYATIINEAIQEMVAAGEAGGGFNDVTHNSDYTEFEVTTTYESINLVQGISALALWYNGARYNAYAGNDCDDIIVYVKNENSGEIVTQFPPAD